MTPARSSRSTRMPRRRSSRSRTSVWWETCSRCFPNWRPPFERAAVRRQGSRMMKRVAILQSNYVPWKGYFDIIASVDEFIVYDCVQYTKNDWRHRNQIKTEQGKVWRQVPVRQRSSDQTIEQPEKGHPNCFLTTWTQYITNYAKGTPNPPLQ